MINPQALLHGLRVIYEVHYVVHIDRDVPSSNHSIVKLLQKFVLFVKLDIIDIDYAILDDPWWLKTDPIEIEFFSVDFSSAFSILF